MSCPLGGGVMTELERITVSGVEVSSKNYDSIDADVYLCSGVVPYIAELEHLLRERDGGVHDADCKANYGRQCNCGHDAVTRYFEEVEE